MQAAICYTTVDEETTANSLAALVVKGGLAACVNIIPEVRSVYHWKGKVEQGQEWSLMIKTSGELVGAVLATLKEHHPAKVPCLLSWEIDQIDPDYAAWLQSCLEQN